MRGLLIGKSLFNLRGRTNSPAAIQTLLLLGFGAHGTHEMHMAKRMLHIRMLVRKGTYLIKTSDGVGGHQGHEGLHHVGNSCQFRFG